MGSFTNSSTHQPQPQTMKMPEEFHRKSLRKPLLQRHYREPPLPSYPTPATSPCRHRYLLAIHPETQEPAVLDLETHTFLTPAHDAIRWLSGAVRNLRPVIVLPPQKTAAKALTLRGPMEAPNPPPDLRWSAVQVHYPRSQQTLQFPEPLSPEEVNTRISGYRDRHNDPWEFWIPVKSAPIRPFF